MTTDPQFKWQIVALVFTQLFMVWLIRDASWLTVVLLAYFFGGFVNHALMLGIHEIAHNQAFGPSWPLANRLFGIFAILPVGLPASAAFRRYHMDHHRYQGVDTADVELPTDIEARIFSRTTTKLLWLFLQPFCYILRTELVHTRRVTLLEIVNTVVQLAFDGLVYYYGGDKVLFYLIGGTLLSMGLHPMAGHLVSEHCVFQQGVETYSYYGCLNRIAFNAGYHVEHHDFPSVPGSKLPMVKKIAGEFYNDRPQHSSWVKVLYDFVVDPNIGPYARIKRTTAGKLNNEQFEAVD